MALSVSGLGSSLPVDDLISKLMSVESQPLQKLNGKEASYLAKVSALGQIKGAVSAFQTATRALQDSGKFNAVKSSSGNADVVTISAGSKAASANYSIKVEELAQSQKLASGTFSSASSAIGGGKLTFTFGTTGGGSFTPNAEKIPKTVTIPDNATLNDIRDAVNKADIGVSASVVNDGSGNRLVFSSNTTGTASTLKIENSDDGGALAGFAHVPGGSTLTEVQAAKDARFTLDGLTIVKQSNTVTDAVEGLTLTLKQKQKAEDAAVSLSVTRDSSGIKKTIEDFVKSFNELNSALTEASSVDMNATTKPGEARPAAALSGETVIRTIRTQIRNVFNSVQDVGGAYRVPADVGLGFNQDGSMKLDTGKLQKAIDSNPQDILKLFGSVGTPTDPQVSFVSASGKTASGEYTVNVGSLPNGVLGGAGVVPASLTVAPGGQNFQVKIDGSSSASLTLPAGTYTPASLATALQTAINGDATLTAAGAKVAVSVDSVSGKLVMSSQKTGTSSTVEVLSGLDAVGTSPVNLFNNGAGVAGSANVSGTIGGYAATGNGTVLTGATGTPVEGLAIDIGGGPTGERGTVGFAKGFAFALDGVLAQLLDDKKGAIASRTEGLNNSVKELGKQRDVLGRRLEDVEKRYRAQFTALDAMVSQFNNIGNFLSQQLAGLNKS